MELVNNGFTYHCGVHNIRPVPCRGFDCMNNDKWRVWLDYDLTILNEDLAGAIDEDNRKRYHGG
jgi:hypothetical protein